MPQPEMQLILNVTSSDDQDISFTLSFYNISDLSNATSGGQWGEVKKLIGKKVNLSEEAELMQFRGNQWWDSQRFFGTTQETDTTVIPILATNNLILRSRGKGTLIFNLDLKSKLSLEQLNLLKEKFEIEMIFEVLLYSEPFLIRDEKQMFLYRKFLLNKSREPWLETPYLFINIEAKTVYQLSDKKFIIDPQADLEIEEEKNFYKINLPKEEINRLLFDIEIQKVPLLDKKRNENAIVGDVHSTRCEADKLREPIVNLLKKRNPPIKSIHSLKGKDVFFSFSSNFIKRERPDLKAKGWGVSQVIGALVVSFLLEESLTPPEEAKEKKNIANIALTKEGLEIKFPEIKLKTANYCKHFLEALENAGYKGCIINTTLNETNKYGHYTASITIPRADVEKFLTQICHLSRKDYDDLYKNSPYQSTWQSVKGLFGY